jgi:hypothetical protein
MLPAGSDGPDALGPRAREPESPRAREPRPGGYECQDPAASVTLVLYAWPGTSATTSMPSYTFALGPSGIVQSG